MDRDKVLMWAWRLGLVFLVLAVIALRIEFDKYEASKIILVPASNFSTIFHFNGSV